MPRAASSERLARILALVPWVLAHPEQASVEAVCNRFYIDRQQLQEDIDLLMVCGTPPFQPGDYIEAWIDNDKVTIQMADYLAKPLRLTRWEAVTLVAAARALRQLPGLQEPEALSSAIDKVARMITQGEDQAATLLAERVAIELDPSPTEVVASLRRAIEHKHTLSIEYYSFGRDELTTRAFDPWLVFGSTPWYVIGFDHRSQGRRTFRVDRIRKIAITDRSFERPAGFDPVREAEAPLYHPGAEDVTVVIEVSPSERWVAEVTPIESAQELPDGWTRITLRAGSLSWLARLGLQLSDQLRVVLPNELRDEIQTLARKTLERYQAAR
ncbi:MAG: helix-turn-helix transcriptional regulator [Actinomycetota bacterium]